MSAMTPSVQAPKVSTGGGGGGPISRYPGGGGGGRGGGDSSPDFGELLRRYRLGMAIALTAVFMLFITFTSAFMIRHSVANWDPQAHAYVRDWQPVRLPTGLLFINTLVLLASSFTLEKTRRAAFRQAAISPITASIPGVKWHREQTGPWLGLTVTLGLTFLGGQMLAWHVLAQRGFFLATNSSSSFVYVLTGMHAVHLAGGVLALLYAAVVQFRSRGLERRRIVLDVTAWYWHFMAMLWVYIFVLMEITT